VFAEASFDILRVLWIYAASRADVLPEKRTLMAVLEDLGGGEGMFEEDESVGEMGEV
jgi:hypothetical protein